MAEFIFDENLLRNLVQQHGIDNERNTKKRPDMWKELIIQYNLSIVDGEKLGDDCEWFTVSKKWSNMKQRDNGNK